MKFKILNVGHGFCAYVMADNGNLMMFDCGHDNESGIRPSEHLSNLKVDKIHRLVITNYDEDHISDLPNIRKKFNISILCRNKSISAESLKKLKLRGGPLSSAMKCLLNMIQNYTLDVQAPPYFPEINYKLFFNEYSAKHSDTNNISLVTFLDCKSTRFLIPGDIEYSGWDALLQKNEFKKYLQEVSVFIASHHGRENGYHEGVFQFCKPNVVIISDGKIQYATQQMTQKYGNHAKGIQFNGKTRSVLTTRLDGSLSWNFK